MPSEEEVKAYLSKRLGKPVVRIAPAGMMRCVCTFCKDTEEPCGLLIMAKELSGYTGETPEYDMAQEGGFRNFCLDQAACEKRVADAPAEKERADQEFRDGIVLPD